MENKRETGDHPRAMVGAAPTPGRAQVFSENSARRLKAWLQVIRGFVLSCGALHFTPNITKFITPNGIGLVMLDGSRRKVCPRRGRVLQGTDSRAGGERDYGKEYLQMMCVSVCVCVHYCVYIHT